MLCGHLLLGSVGVIWNLPKFLKFMVAEAGIHRMFESRSNIEPDNDRLGHEIPIPNSNIYWFPSSCWNVRKLNNPASWGLFWNLSIPTSYSPFEILLTCCSKNTPLANHDPRHYLMQGPKSGSPSAMSPVEIWNSYVENIFFGFSCWVKDCNFLRLLCTPWPKAVSHHSKRPLFFFSLSLSLSLMSMN